MSQIYTGEPKRGCGFRKLGGLYLVSDKASLLSCQVMPFPLLPCQHCGQMIKFSRGYTWVKPGYFSTACKEARCPAQGRCAFTAPARVTCPTCQGEGVTYECDIDQIAVALGMPEYEGEECTCRGSGQAINKVGLLWVGREFYTTESFVAEATTLGISKRLATVPRELVLGQTWVMLASKHVMPCDCTGLCEICEGRGTVSAVFYAFKPDRLEMIVTADMLVAACPACLGSGEEQDDEGHTGTCEECRGDGTVPSKLSERMQRQNITPVIVSEEDLEDEDKGNTGSKS